MSDGTPRNYRIVLGLETQVPYHSRQLFAAFLGFIGDYGPNEIIGMGDHLDCPAPSRWNRGTAAEYGGNLQREVDTMRGMLWDIRTVFGGRFSVHKGNHEERIDTYTRTKAPAFASLDCLTVSELLQYDALDIWERQPIEDLRKGTGWVTSHGHLGSLSRTSGGTAKSLANRLGKSVICGHTHRMGVINSTVGTKVTSGVETGHMMDLKKASYIKTGAPDWQSGWVVAEITKKGNVAVQLVPVSSSGVVTYNGY